MKKRDYMLSTRQAELGAFAARIAAAARRLANEIVQKVIREELARRKEKVDGKA